jgi:hypothetical protein
MPVLPKKADRSICMGQQHRAAGPSISSEKAAIEAVCSEGYSAGRDVGLGGLRSMLQQARQKNIGRR